MRRGVHCPSPWMHITTYEAMRRWARGKVNDADSPYHTEYGMADALQNDTSTYPYITSVLVPLNVIPHFLVVHNPHHRQTQNKTPSVNHPDPT
ncbi:hypothetical protein ASPCADRAFT_205474 [Aspergillus carbonarius ITEM 5010]|uniref:Uncharacterized protein n=1 Tax=Aspergillus carbonarius (strain ITEM 5010) TaxID=602072 RepID=A0A1R3RUT8_ASPC5|nr:hypothetical protein ASPCADRAFT_205474 [Aspergillus carbonarius ITEM 5010]